MEERLVSAKGHSILIKDRESITITGVLDVLSFDENNIDIETEMVMLTIKGNELHVNKLNLEKKELELEGELESLDYNDGDSFGKGGSSLLGRLFK